MCAVKWTNQPFQLQDILLVSWLMPNMMQIYPDPIFITSINTGRTLNFIFMEPYNLISVVKRPHSGH